MKVNFDTEESFAIDVLYSKDVSTRLGRSTNVGIVEIPDAGTAFLAMVAWVNLAFGAC